MPAYRLNKAIALTGFCSRRNADDLIRSGRVQVNGAVTRDFNQLIDFTRDRLTVDGNEIAVQSFEYIAMHKPSGVVTTCDDEYGRTVILDLLPNNLRHLKPVGRLDLDSEGLLLLTNDGALAYKLTHPAKVVEKNYEVTVAGEISDDVLSHLERGVCLSDGMTHPANVTLLERNKDLSRFQIAIHEGRNRQIRRMCAQVGYPVVRLIRVSIGGLQLNGLKSSQWRHLTAEEVATLHRDS
jgi:23S rRNA pseudouridine2605 synthase